MLEWGGGWPRLTVDMICRPWFTLADPKFEWERRPMTMAYCWHDLSSLIYTGGSNVRGGGVTTAYCLHDLSSLIYIGGSSVRRGRGWPRLTVDIIWIAHSLRHDMVDGHPEEHCRPRRSRGEQCFYMSCDIQNCHPAIWQIRVLEINMRYNNMVCRPWWYWPIKCASVDNVFSDDDLLSNENHAAQVCGWCHHELYSWPHHASN